VGRVGIIRRQESLVLYKSFNTLCVGCLVLKLMAEGVEGEPSTAAAVMLQLVILTTIKMSTKNLIPYDFFFSSLVGNLF
jgi:hypothetical protein